MLPDGMKTVRALLSWGWGFLHGSTLQECLQKVSSSGVLAQTEGFLNCTRSWILCNYFFIYLFVRCFPGVQGGDLYSALRHHPDTMKWERLGRKVALDVALGLNYLHSQVSRT